jgi:DNA-binding MltR family transcriptional regulator
MSDLDNETARKKWLILAEALASESDLRCAIIATAYLDHALAEMLERIFIKSALTEQLVGSTGSGIGTLFNKTRLTYCLGIISKTCMQNLETIGDIRNTFAHDLETTFDTKRVSQKCESLKLPHGVQTGRASRIKRFVAKAHETSKSRFCTVVTFCGIYLAMQTKSLVKRPTASNHYWDQNP